jgi:hypothetical protein
MILDESIVVYNPPLLSFLFSSLFLSFFPQKEVEKDLKEYTTRSWDQEPDSWPIVQFSEDE